MKLDTKQIRQRRFQRALLDLGCSATELASKYGLPYRSVARWLAGSASPGPQRLKKLCRIFNWNYEAMFLREGLEDEALETQQACDPEIPWPHGVMFHWLLRSGAA